LQKNKIVIALVAVAALTLVLVGLAAAQISTNQTYDSSNPNDDAWGWIGNCFGNRANQQYNNQYLAPLSPTDGSAPQAPIKRAMATDMGIDLAG